MENEDQETERMLRWIAGVMGFELHYEAEYVRDGTYEVDRWLFMSRPFPRGYTDGGPGWRMTMSFYTRKKLLDHVLKSRTAFIDGGRSLQNPFYGMSENEIRLRMAADGS